MKDTACQTSLNHPFYINMKYCKMCMILLSSAIFCSLRAVSFYLQFNFYKKQCELQWSLTSRNAPLPFWWWREIWPSPAASGSCWGSRPISPPGSRWWIRCHTPAPGCTQSMASFPGVKASHQSSSAGKKGMRGGGGAMCPREVRKEEERKPKLF